MRRAGLAAILTFGLTFGLALGLAFSAGAANPIVAGWYADPEIRIFAHRYWVFPTYSADSAATAEPARFTAGQAWHRARPGVWAPFLKQTFLDAFSSPDLVHWTRHRHVLDVRKVAWAAYALWAPSIVEKGGRYYLFFGANDVHENELGGIGVAVADRPEGPFRDALGRPLIGGIHNGAQPIDQMVFRDDDGRWYMYYGGWGHCNIVRLSDDFKSVVPFDDGATYKEITPQGYVEGPFMAKRQGRYYLMWSEGDWTGPDYSVAYAISDTPFGPFRRIGKILQQDDRVARGAGHHSIVNIPATDDWYIAYHRRPLDETDGNHRQLAIEHLYFNGDGTIRPVVMTQAGVARRPLP